MEKFRFDRERSTADLLGDLTQEFPEGSFVAVELFDITDREGLEWHAVAYDSGAEKIEPGFEERFLALLDVQIFPCGV